MVFPSLFIRLFASVFIKVLLCWEIKSITSSLVNDDFTDGPDGLLKGCMKMSQKFLYLMLICRKDALAFSKNPFLMKFYSHEGGYRHQVAVDKCLLLVTYKLADEVFPRCMRRP